MQIDFHHAATYVIARLGGLDHPQANIVAHSAQYVDDATNDGLIRFDIGAMYYRIASAHKMLDYRNFTALANQRVWIPFHFLPGNGGKPAGQDPEGGFIEKLVCRPDSYVARDMVRAAFQDRNSPYGLHRLGITLHVYADTWAHQGFAGVSHEINRIACLEDEEQGNRGLRERLSGFFGDLFDHATGTFVGEALPVGHGAALSYPDRPFLTWRYRDHRGDIVERDNPRDFMSAADELYCTVVRYVEGHPDMVVAGGGRLPEPDRSNIETMFRTITHENGDVRHRTWLEHIADGHFSFGPVSLQYVPKGAGSWKHLALATTSERDGFDETFAYDPAFLECDWKRFHDALQAHRFSLLNEVLPRYGICTA